MENFDLEKYLSNGIQNIVKEVMKSTLKNKKESAFVAGFAASCAKSAAARKMNTKKHVPPFLIASITSSCNLHCAGCYARSNNACHDGCERDKLSDDEWRRIFSEASALGISFILLAGGEPLVRRDVLLKAAEIKNIAFPVFTNGTMINDSYCELFDKDRNLIPFLSIEGGKTVTDARRGEGVFDKLTTAMAKLNDKKILFGASVTVTTANMKEVMSREFTENLYSQGCRIIIYVEYVPTANGTEHLAPNDGDREIMKELLKNLREEKAGMLFISFPGDEKTSGGCLAAGRGFFHINSHGGAEPCPFSPYSDTNIRNMPLSKAIDSPLFKKLRLTSCIEGDHRGGCVLFEKKAEVENLVGAK